jgi:putative addiction module killer protein
MYTVVESETFTKWLVGLRDRSTRQRLVARIRKASLGNLGDVKAVGANVWEMREFFGSGWRMYYLHQGDTIILMLGGGNKSTQKKDVSEAQAIAKELES